MIKYSLKQQTVLFSYTLLINVLIIGLDRAVIPDLWVIVFNNLKHSLSKTIIKIINRLPKHAAVETTHSLSKSFVYVYFL